MKRCPEPFHCTWQPVFPADAPPTPTNRLNWYEGVEFPRFQLSDRQTRMQLSGGTTMWTFLAAAGTVLLILTTPVYVGAQKDSGSQKSQAEQLVDAFNKVFGAHPGIRANHSKGVVLDGAFTPSAAAASLSKAAHLQKRKTPIQVTVRFSAGSVVRIADGRDAVPGGMAVSFSLPDGITPDLVVVSVNGFAVATEDEFLLFLRAIAASGP